MQIFQKLLCEWKRAWNKVGKLYIPPRSRCHYCQVITSFSKILSLTSNLFPLPMTVLGMDLPWSYSISGRILKASWSKLEPSQTPEMEFIAKIVNSWKQLTIFTRISILYVWLGTEPDSGWRILAKLIPW